jgi:hypothetical protein
VPLLSVVLVLLFRFVQLKHEIFVVLPGKEKRERRKKREERGRERKRKEEKGRERKKGRERRGKGNNREKSEEDK